MKIKAITLDDEQLPETLDVQITIAEAAAIARVFLHISTFGHTRLGLVHDDTTPYEALIDVIHRFWPGGLDVLVPRIDLVTINDEPA